MTTEQQLTEDLEIGLYPFKWKDAIRLANLQAKHEQGSFDYWMQVRTLFLELGGRYVGQKD
jgi:hypothetical protein